MKHFRLILFFLLFTTFNLSAIEELNVDKTLNLTQEELLFIKNKQNIIIANEYDWIPFDFNENNDAKGYVIDYIKLLSQKIGLEPVFITEKWPTLIEKFKKNEIDVLPVISYNKKRESFLDYTKPFMRQELSIVTRETTTDIINLDDLKGKRVGMMKGWNSTNLLRKKYPRANIIEFDSIIDIFNSIKNNFIDVTIQNELLANYYINRSYIGYLKTVSQVVIPGHKNELLMGTKKNLKTLNTLLNKAINSVTKKELEILDKKWINYGKNIYFTEEEKDFIKNKTIKAIGVSNWAPFNFISDNTNHGLSLDFLKLIANKSNLKIEISNGSKFYELLDTIKNKEKDLIIATTKTIDREKYAIFSNSYLTTPIGIATLQDKNYISNASDLLGKKIAVGKNYSAHKLLEEKYPDMNFVFVENIDEGLNTVTEGKAFAYVDIMPVLSYNIQNHGFTNIKISGQTGIDFKLRFMIRDDYKELKTIIDKVLINMTREEKESLYDKWLKINFVKEMDYSLLWKVLTVFLIILLFILYKNKQLLDYQRNLKKTQKELEDSLDNFRSLIDLNIAGVLIIQDKKIRYLNDEIVKILEYQNKAQIINKNINTILERNSLINIFESKEEDTYEINAIKVDGSTIPILLKVKEINFDNKDSYILSIVNLKEIKNKEELLVHQSKMASLGEMIGNIAHQWRQPLSSISTAASGMKVQKEFGLLTDEIFYYNVDSITETTKFLSQTIDDFQEYIKNDKEKQLFKLNDSIKKVLSIMKGSFVNNFINLKQNTGNIEVNGYANELNQALLNILTNSKDALKNVEENSRYIFINSYEETSYAVIEIIDTAGGIPNNIIKKVFEPYFTTKHKSQGTGLGLYMTHKIITDSMEGKIKIENCSYENFEKCTKVTLFIPSK